MTAANLVSDSCAADVCDAVITLGEQADDLHRILITRADCWGPAERSLARALPHLAEARAGAELAVSLSPPRPRDWRRGDFVQTFTGRKFWPLDPRPEDVDPADLAHHLAGKNRYGAATSPYYTVAAHSVAVMRMAMTVARKEGLDPREVGIIALLHDTDEAYLPDVPRPIKAHIPGWLMYEQAVRLSVRERFGLGATPYEAQLITQECDEYALWIEIESMSLDPEKVWPCRGKEPLDADVREAGRLVYRESQQGDADAFLAALRDLLPAEVLKPVEVKPPPKIDPSDTKTLAETFLALPPPERVTEYGLALANRLARSVVPAPRIVVSCAECSSGCAKCDPHHEPPPQPKGSWMAELAPEVDERVARNQARLARGD